MNSQLPFVCLVRHGETAWSLSGQHTGLTDLALTERGKVNAVRLSARLKGLTFGQVLTSPLKRAKQTCELAGFGAIAEVDDDLVEWNYGAYEGKTSAEIYKQQPEWNLFQDGCPQGESVAEIGGRADRVVERIREFDGNVLLFSSGHFLRVLAARWIGLEAKAGQHFYLGTASLSIICYEHNRRDPVIRLWNEQIDTTESEEYERRATGSVSD